MVVQVLFETGHHVQMMVMASTKMRQDGIPTLDSRIPELKVGSLTLKLFSADGFIFDE
jgi:hypothetical protein